jgi:hypothetical protein
MFRMTRLLLVRLLLMQVKTGNLPRVYYIFVSEGARIQILVTGYSKWVNSSCEEKRKS